LDKAAPSGPVRNKIETLWHRIKSLVYHNHDPYLTFHAKVNAAFCSL